MKNRTVLISGAGIAGPALATWLQRYGFEPTVVERAPSPRSGGHAVDIRGTARTVVEKLGIVPQVRQAHTGAQGMAFVDHRGKPVAKLGLDVYGDSGGPVAEMAIRRTDLAKILHDVSEDHVEYLFDDSISSVEQDESGVRVELVNGGSRHFDLLVGADGIRSNVRRLVFGPEENYIRDLGCFVALFTIPKPVELDGWQLMHTMAAGNGRPGRTASLGPVPEPGRTMAGFFWRSDERHFDRRDVEMQKYLVERTFAGDPWEVSSALSGLRDTPDFFFDRIGQVEMDRWSLGRTVLLGDAGYCASPMSGIGTSLSLVGAYVLAGELAAADGDHTIAFVRYEQEMREFVDRAQAFARGAGDGGLMPDSNRQIWMRNQVVRTLPYLPKRLMARGMDRVAHTVQLQDYPVPAHL